MKDLYARYYYNPIVCAIGWEEPIRLSTLDMNKLLISALDPPKPYLRPMSSMTEEELKEYENARDDYYDDLKTYDWLNAHYFDYRGLIKKGLAIEAPKGMYNTKK